MPDLIELTSSVFASVFPQQGIPEEHVRLTPADRAIAIPSGPVIERLALQSKNKADDALALATCIDELLQDPTVQVRDRDTGALRAVQAGDVAVLCRRNDHCVAVADALTRLGHRASLSRPGLLGTTEGRVAFAALRRFVDPRDRLAGAELLRFVRYPEDPDAWLATQIAVDAEPDPLLLALSQCAREHPTAGPLEALDLCLDVVALPDLCHRWDNTAMRLANLEQLRAHVEQFVAAQAGQRRPVTTRALVEYLAEIRAAGVAQMDASYIDKMIAARRLTKRMTYTGYLRRSLPKTQSSLVLEKIEAPYILVTVGGGGDGEEIIDWVLRAYESDAQLPYPALLVLGPFMSGERQSEFLLRAARLRNVEAITFDARIESLVDRAIGVVSMGGYNTFCEILSFDKRAVVVPRTQPRMEQFLRASKAQELGLVHMLLDDGRRDARDMATALRHLPQQNLPSAVVVPGLLDGRRNVVRLGRKWLTESARRHEVIEQAGSAQPKRSGAKRSP